MFRTHVPTTVFISFAIAFGVPQGGAVTTTGTILGTVTDASGAIVPGAEVAVTNVATGEARKFTTDSFGSYVFPELKPGSYGLRVMAPGFKTKEVKGIVLQVEQRARVDI